MSGSKNSKTSACKINTSAENLSLLLSLEFEERNSDPMCYCIEELRQSPAFSAILEQAGFQKEAELVKKSRPNTEKTMEFSDLTFGLMLFCARLFQAGRFAERHDLS